MKKINMEGVECIYLFTEDHLSDEMMVDELTISNLYLGERAFVERKIKEGENIRIVLVASRKAFGTPALEFHILLCRDQSGVGLLDQRILTDTFSDDDFSDTILAKYQRTFCTNCDWVGDTLVVHKDTLNPQLSKVLRNKLQKWEFKNCPKCGRSLRQPVIHIFNL